MRVLVLGGAGFIGETAVEDLVRTSDFSEIVIGDIDVQKAQKLVSRLNDPRLTMKAVDVTKETQLLESVRGFDVVTNALPFKYDLAVTKACIEAGVNGIDVSATREQLELDSEAKSAGVKFVLGCGATPGITNILARRGADMLDKVSEIQIAWAAFRCTAPAPGLLHTTLWEFDPRTEDRVYYADGQFIKVPPFSGERVVEFAKPIGTQNVYYVPHPETITLPRFLPSLRKVEVRGTWPSETMRFLRFMNTFGFYRKEPVEVKGQSVVPYDWMHDYMMKCPEAKETSIWAYGLIVEVIGSSKRKKIKHSFRTSHPRMDKWGGKSAYARNVGYPLSIGTQMLAKGQVNATGVIAPEAAFNPSEFIRELSKREIKVSHRTEKAV